MLIKKFTSYIFPAALLLLTACTSVSTPRPDHRIVVVPTNSEATSFVAIPPECLPWHETVFGFNDNQPLATFGCANARNLALSVEKPSDLIAGRDPGIADASKAASAIQRYQAGQVLGLFHNLEPPSPIEPGGSATEK
jgi:hypothetical protein